MGKFVLVYSTVLTGVKKNFPLTGRAEGFRGVSSPHDHVPLGHACPAVYAGLGIEPVASGTRGDGPGSREVMSHDAPWDLRGPQCPQSYGV